MTTRYRIYRYRRDHWAIDCLDCNCKIGNLKSDFGTVQVTALMVAVENHEQSKHDGTF